MATPTTSNSSPGARDQTDDKVSRSTPDTERLLLDTASAIAGESEFSALADRLGRAVLGLPGIRTCGLGVYDEQREVFIVYLTVADPESGARSQGLARVLEFDARESEVGVLQGLAATHLSVNLSNGRSNPLQDTLHQLGIRRQVSVPMVVRGRLLGALVVGSADAEPLVPETNSLLERLAHLATPVLWNCVAQQFFTKGDSRRDTLIELSNAINSGLELDTVIRSTHQAVGRLEGYCLSAIELLEDGNATYVSHRSDTGGHARASEPARGPVASRTIEWVLTHRQTYQSGDLRAHLEFDNDAGLQSQGVRRYVAAPLFARGRIMGAFLFGSTSAHPLRKVDVWLYENIAMQLALAIDNALQHERVHRLSERLARENVYLREELQAEHSLSGMVGASQPMERVRESIARVAATQTLVLITGETGVGKELVARAIHDAGPRSGRPMVKVNCAAIPDGMTESELFGHERGAFTSAVQRRIGRFELAHDSSLFLDEIGELPPATQAKLLHVLQDGEFQRVGGTERLVSNARIIAATNRDLAKAVESGAFRADLYFRLNVFPIDVPPLDQRREDIPLLAEAFMAYFGRAMGKRIDEIAPTSLEYLCNRDWPGNVRELRHWIERAVILCDSSMLTVAMTHPEIHRRTKASTKPGPPTLKTLQTEHILRVLDSCAYVIEGPNGAATALGMKPSTLRFRMKRLGIERRPAAD